MHTQVIGASARFFINGLTLVLSAFAAWGWFAEVRAWPPQFSDFGVLAMAAVTLTAQQIANAMAAHAFYAFQRGAWASAMIGALLSLAFAGATAFGVDHAFTTAQAMLRAEAAAAIESDLAAATRDVREANARLVSLPTDIPASRLVVLQAPLQAALEAAEAREADARARYGEATAPSETDALFQRIFEVLSFCEIGLYWVLAASQSHVRSQASQSQLQPQSQEQSQSRPRVSRRRRPMPGAGVLNGLLSGTALAWSPIAPGAARPAPLPYATPATMSVPPPTPSPVALSDAPSAEHRVRCGTRRSGGTRPTVSREPPNWLGDAEQLRAAGLSFRAIAIRLDVPKSTVWRWLQAH
ncbi:MAG: helix-turn-helix domain-containing protein [Hyphomonadaceae bacterium]